MGNHGLSDCIESTLVRLKNSTHECESICLNVSLLHCVDLAHASFKNLCDELTCISIDEDHPFTNQESFCLEFNLYRFQHLDGLNHYWERRLWHSSIVSLEKDKEHFEGSLDLGGKLNSICNLVRSQLEEWFILKHGSIVLQVVWVHCGDPLHKSDVIWLNLRLEQSLFVSQLFTQEHFNRYRVYFSLLFQWADGRQELAWVQVKVVIQDQQRTLFLETPYFDIEFRVLDIKQLSIHRVVCQ